MAKPNTTDYPAYFSGYIEEVPEDDLSEALKKQANIIPNFLNSISEDKSTYSYAEGKWSIKRMMQHITDTERIFNYRALCIARGEAKCLLAFDENIYADNSNADVRSWQSLVDEFNNVRRSTEDLYNSFNEEKLDRKGLSGNNDVVSVLSYGFITIGHLYHHKRIIRERYL